MTAGPRVQIPKPPGRGGRAAAHPKGRQVEPQALAEVRALLGETPRRRDLLIEHLHRLQDAVGGLKAAHLAALAEEMRLSLAEVYEVATFYHNFEVVKVGPVPLPAIRVCASLCCAMQGAGRLMEELAARAAGRFRVVPTACLGRCDRAPAARIGTHCLAPAGADAAIAELAAPPAPVRAAVSLADYRAAGGYALLGRCRDGALTADAVIAALDEAGLRGLGGAGFPTARKWRLVRAQPAPRLLAVNADESEPGTFKDRHFLLADPHRFLEGMLIAAWAIDAKAIYIYLRDEYADIRALLDAAIGELGAPGAPLPAIHLRRGAGAYICGEESAMLESLEGKRGLPRHKPPFPAEVGLFGRPTLINNVETLYWVRDIVEKGPAAFLVAGRRGRRGLRAFSVSGRVREPGVKLAPAGISVRELIDEFCGGMAEGHRLKGYLPGGASGGILPASLADLPLDFGTLEAEGCFIGSAAIIVLSEADDIRAVAVNLMQFFKDESCGQCTPCRVGTEKALALMQRARWDECLLKELAQCMADASICGLGQAAPNGLLSAYRHFAAELG
jgi:formate dehydrogenase